ncbi:MAG: hypothetical protein FWE14_09390 [Lachnospiraceae bacterium]|nr:hypothetical protein [Lachnospiraceae bacterium]
MYSNERIKVSCLIDRYWDHSTKKWRGKELDGVLLEISTQTDEDGSGKLIPVGIVMPDDNDNFIAVPIEFISRTKQ